ncbi:MAG TPA: adenine phosphoribosyltransferase [Gemmatimonadales bacterium]|jgi:adenine phosphoribosyltransferase|nr:adenine phosphoribosyltransferase [Gemmatimonadales bacterium]
MDPNVLAQLRSTLRPIPDHPKPGIVFQDITPVLQNGLLLRQLIEGLAEPFGTSAVSHVVGIEARGFILAAPVAVLLGAGFIPLRKPGKLPWQRIRHEYELEYGTDALEGHSDACPPGARVLVVDDVLATGGTAHAAGELVRKLGGEVVGWSFMLEIEGLRGAGRLLGAPVHTLMSV